MVDAVLRWLREALCMDEEELETLHDEQDELAARIEAVEARLDLMEASIEGQMDGA